MTSERAIAPSAASEAAAFDYASVDQGTAIAARDLAERVRSFELRVMSQIVDLGGELIRMKERLGHGRFTPWLRAEFSGKDRTAQRYMAAHEAFAGKSATVSVLKPAVAHVIAAAPAAIRHEIIAEIEGGARPQPFEVRRRVAEARQEEREAAKLAKLSPEERKALASKKKRRQADRARREAEWKADSEARAKREFSEAQAGEDLAKLLAERLSRDDARQVVNLLTKAGNYCAQRVRSRMASIIDYVPVAGEERGP